MQPTRTMTQRPMASIMMTGMLASMMVFFLLATAQGAAPEMTDRDIAGAVERELATDPMVSAVNIEVTVTDGTAVLTGEVDNLLAKDRAEEIAGTIRGVRSVTNKILVVAPEDPKSDRQVRQDVEAALRLNAATDAYEINTGVSGHVVTLSGSVDSWQEKQLAEKVVKGVSGVWAVVNDIAVAEGEKRPDWEIRADIRSRLRWSARVDDALVDIQVKEGKVRLTGSVSSTAEKNTAIANAWVRGTRSVDAGGLAVAPDPEADPQDEE